MSAKRPNCTIKLWPALACVIGAPTAMAASCTPALAQAEVPLPPHRPSELAIPQPEPDAPLPPVRPADLAAPPPTPPPPQPPPPAISLPPPPVLPPAQSPPAAMPTVPEEVAACRALLARGNVTARLVPAVTGENGCGIANPVSLEAVRLDDGAVVALSPPALVRCDLAQALADWVRQDMAAFAQAQGSPLVRLSVGGGYECRGRNQVAGARLSEHGRGNALDLIGLEMANRQVVAIAKPEGASAWMTQLKSSACTRFATVLGPGSDGYHETHLHVDLEPRRHGTKLCQWQLN